MKFEQLVRLVVPDNTASTAKRTAIAMGYPIEDVQREDYYAFEADEDLSEKLAKTDILVNANKHKCVIRKEGEALELKSEKGAYTFKILVTDKDNGAAGLVATLKERLGFTGIKSMTKGTLWTLCIKAKDEGEAKKTALALAEELLHNKHYQNYNFYQ